MQTTSREYLPSDVTHTARHDDGAHILFNSYLSLLVKHIYIYPRTCYTILQVYIQTILV